VQHALNQILNGGILLRLFLVRELKTRIRRFRIQWNGPEPG